MDLGLSFSVLVLTTCAIDLIWSVAGRIDSWWHRRFAAGGYFSTGGGAYFPPQRGDWYVFFHCADFVGAALLSRQTRYPQGE